MYGRKPLLILLLIMTWITSYGRPSAPREGQQRPRTSYCKTNEWMGIRMLDMNTGDSYTPCRFSEFTNPGRPIPLSSNLQADQGTVTGKGFQVEVFGGMSIVSPRDLNSRADAYNEYYRLNYDQDPDLKQIRNMLPVGVRIKYFINHHWSLSLGFEYATRTCESNTAANIGAQSEFLDVKLFAEAFSPQVGIHYHFDLSESLGLEFFGSAGASFGSCSYDVRVEQRDTFTDALDWYQYSGAKGNGMGYTVEGGLRMNLDLSESLTLFLETGYALQKLRGFSGPGYVERPGVSDDWEGEWGMRTWEITPSHEVEIVSNLWEDGDYELDLSGFRIRIGCGFRF